MSYPPGRNNPALVHRNAGPEQKESACLSRQFQYSTATPLVARPAFGAERIITSSAGTFSYNRHGLLALTLAVEDRHGDIVDVVAWGRDPCRWWLRRGDLTPILGALSAQRRERLAEHLHRLGSRPCLEALIEVADGADLDGVLIRYSRLDPDIVKALRGDRFPPLPIHAVPS